MRILVTGARGLLGRSCMAVGKGRHDLLGMGARDLDVTDRGAVERTVAALKPHGVIHCAAYTDVDGAERDEGKARAVNGDAAEWVARACRRAGAVMVYISTDYVFDGRKRTPYRESDPPHPTSRYGISKLEGERRVVESHPEGHLIVRTAWLYGAGAGFVDWVCSGLEEGRALRLVADHRGSPTYAIDLAGALFRLVEQDRRGVFHYVNRGETSWFELGLAVARLTGKPDRCLSTTTAQELGRAAPRPAYSVLAVDTYEETTGDRVADWQDALERYLASAGRLPPS